MKKILLPTLLTLMLAVSVAMAASDSVDQTPAYKSKIAFGFNPVVEVRTNVRKVGIVVGESEAQKAEAQTVAKTAIVQKAVENTTEPVNAVEYSTDLASLRALYREAASSVGIDWKLIEAVHQVETGKSTTCKSSSAGARGPMQFLPSTFRHYGEGGNICDLRDSVFAAARLLANAGADTGDIDSALFSYNHSSSYVQLVKSVMASI